MSKAINIIDDIEYKSIDSNIIENQDDPIFMSSRYFENKNLLRELKPGTAQFQRLKSENEFIYKKACAVLSNR